jgi:hypothetical protein
MYYLSLDAGKDDIPALMALADRRARAVKFSRMNVQAGDEIEVEMTPAARHAAATGPCELVGKQTNNTGLHAVIVRLNQARLHLHTVSQLDQMFVANGLSDCAIERRRDVDFLGPHC